MKKMKRSYLVETKLQKEATQVQCEIKLSAWTVVIPEAWLFRPQEAHKKRQGFRSAPRGIGKAKPAQEDSSFTAGMQSLNRGLWANAQVEKKSQTQTLSDLPLKQLVVLVSFFFFKSFF
jgi:hypothetical protein